MKFLLAIAIALVLALGGNSNQQAVNSDACWSDAGLKVPACAYARSLVR